MSNSSIRIQPAVAAAVAAILAASAAAHAADSAPLESAPATEAAPAATEEVVITGSRQAGLTVAESPAPIQLVSSDALEAAGKPDLMSSLATIIPSLTTQAFGGDMANQTLQAKLRGLSPNHVLVLVNGKRRHTTSNLAVLGGAYQGGAGVDLNFIPMSAIDHVEVLTDGAAAQYGSDAIAGVINIILKTKSSGATIGANYGGYFDGGGQTGGMDGNFGFEFGDGGYLNLTGQVSNHGHSYRGDIDARVLNPSYTSGINANSAYSWDYPYVNHIQGDAESHLQVASFNAGMPLGGGAEFYAFGTYGKKDAASFENWRNPSRVSYTSGGVTTYPFPNGFNPREATKETDVQVSAGIKGKLADWNWDLAAGYGKDDVPMYTLDSINSGIYGTTGVIGTTNFYDGALIASQANATLDINKDFDVGLAGPLNVAFGAEGRHDIYHILEGQKDSWYLAGAQSFPGFSPTDASSHGRNNYAGYVDVAGNFVPGLRLDAAARYEHYSDFGNTTIGKLTGRYDFSDAFALRGTISTGFRAPTLAEEYYSSTNVGPTSIYAQLPPNSSFAAQLGLGSGLKAEKSTNFSLGVVLRPTPAMTTTLDVYQISIRDRIVGTGNLQGTLPDDNGNAVVYSQAVVDTLAAAGVVIDSQITETGINVFTNGVNTRTRGADLVFSLPVEYAIGHIDWSVGATYNSTEVTKVRSTPSELAGTVLFDKAAISDLETASPRYVVNLGANWSLGKLSVNLKESIYGKASEWGQGYTGDWYLTTIGVTPITNLDLGYKVSEALKVSIGGTNLFNKYPDEINGDQRQSYLAHYNNGYVTKYPSFSPFGINGGYYYAKASYSF